MRILSAADVDALGDMPSMVEAMRGAFRDDYVQPVRHHHAMQRPGAADATLLLMPAWTGTPGRAYTGVKIVTVSPDNARLAKPSVQGVYILNDGETGEPLAVIDGQALTTRRTAAASGLAATFLARADASRHLVIGAGAMAPFLAQAMRAVRRIDETLVWARAPDKALALADHLERHGMPARAVTDLQAAVEAADIVSAATLSREPLVRGAWLRPGTHLDLVGAFSPDMRESDDEAVRRATVFVDTRDGALAEGGDLVQAIAAGALAAADIAGDLAELTRGLAAGRSRDDEITLFKSVGAAREDLAAAILVYERALARDLVGAAG